MHPPPAEARRQADAWAGDPRVGTGGAPGHTILALEAVSGLAAIYVLFGHMANVYFGKPAWAFLFSFSAEAVIAFFLLSGFVIRWSTPDGIGLAEYARKRFRRIYPLYAIGIALAYALASIEQGGLADPRWPRLLGNLAMLQDFGFGRPGVWVEQYYNLVLWSLSYEAWFYALFFLQLRLRARWRTMATLVLCAVGFGVHYVFPNQLAYFAIYFVIWSAGAAMAGDARRNGLPSWRACLGWAAVMLIGAAAWLPALATSDTREFGLYPLVDIRRFVAAAVLLVASTAVTRGWERLPGRLFRATIGRFAWTGVFSYALYISHFPVVQAFAVLAPGWAPWIAIPAICATAFALAWLLELRLQPLFVRLLR